MLRHSSHALNTRLQHIDIESCWWYWMSQPWFRKILNVRSRRGGIFNPQANPVCATTYIVIACNIDHDTEMLIIMMCMILLLCLSFLFFVIIKYNEINTVINNIVIVMIMQCLDFIKTHAAMPVARRVIRSVGSMPFASIPQLLGELRSKQSKTMIELLVLWLDWKVITQFLKKRKMSIVIFYSLIIICKYDDEIPISQWTCTKHLTTSSQ